MDLGVALSGNMRRAHNARLFAKTIWRIHAEHLSRHFRARHSFWTGARLSGLQTYDHHCSAWVHVGMAGKAATEPKARNAGPFYAGCYWRLFERKPLEREKTAIVCRLSKEPSKEDNLFFLEQEPCREHGNRTQQPLNAPQLHSLPVQQGGRGEDKSRHDCRYDTGTSQYQRD